MRYWCLLICIASMIFLAANAVSEDSYLSENSGNQDIAETMQSDIFNTSHSNIGSSISTSVTKKTPVVISSSSKSSVVGSSQVENEIAQLAGRWHFELVDSITRSLNLSLFQSNDVIFGAGSMTSGNVIQEVAAYGSVAGSKLGLELISMSDINLFQLSLDLKMPSASGSYKAFSIANATWTGTATGNISA